MFNSRTKVVLESINVVVDDSPTEVDVTDDFGSLFPMDDDPEDVTEDVGTSHDVY